MDPTAIFEPFWAPLVDPTHRTYWGFLAGAVVLAALCGGLSRLFDRRVWTHPSAVVDYQLLILKTVGRWVWVAPWGAATVAIAAGVARSLGETFGAAPDPGLSRPAIAALYTFALFFVWDASRYVLHRLLHRIPALWELHQVHHSAEVLTPVTFYRTHPVESALYRMRDAVATGVVTGVFFWAFRGVASPWEFVGVSALGFGFNLLGGNLRHSHVHLSWGPVVERVFISPAQHQLHHSAAPEHHDRNFGAWLSLWDQLGGTFAPASKDELTFGLPKDTRNHDPDDLLAALVAPMRGFMRPATVGAVLLAAAAFVAVPALADEPSQGGNEPDVRGEEPPETGEDGRDEGEVQDAEQDETKGQDEGEVQEADRGETTESGEGEARDAGQGKNEQQGDVQSADQSEIAGQGEGDIQDAEQEPASPKDEVRTTAEDEAEDLEGINVTVVGVSRPVRRVAGSAHRVEEETLERREYNDIHRILAPVPGVYVREEDGFGLRPNIGLRGAAADRSSKVTLMEDGILLGPAPYSAPAAYFFPMSTRMVGVDVFKGPAAIRFGPNTVGGAIDLRTRPIPGVSDGAVDLSFGLRNTWKLHAWGGLRSSFGGLLLEGVHLASDGFKNLPSGADTGFDKTEFMFKGGLNSPLGDPVVAKLELKLGWAREVSNETYLGLTDADFEADPYGRYAASALGLMDWNRTQAELTWRLELPAGVRLRVTGYHHWQHRSWRKFNAFRGGPSAPDILAHPEAGAAAVYAAVLRGEADTATADESILIGDNQRTFHSFGVQTIGTWKATGEKVSSNLEVGVRVHGDQIRRDHDEQPYAMTSGILVPEEDEPAFVTQNRGEALAVSAHIHEELKIGPVRVVPGLRVEVVRTAFQDILNDGEPTSAVRAIPLPGLGVHARPTPWLAVFGGVNRGFSPVSPGQDPDVKPESSWNFELGTRLNRKDIAVEVVGFFNDYSNLTGTCTFSSGCDEALLDTQFNGGAVFVYGVEASYDQRIRLPAGFELHPGLTYTWTGSRFRTSFVSRSSYFGSVTEGDALPYVPVHQGSARLLFVHPFGDVELAVKAQSAMRDVPGQDEIEVGEKIQAYAVLDLATSLRITRHASLYLTINNITNNAYMVSRRPLGARPGRPFHLMVGFKGSFGARGDGVVERLRESRLRPPQTRPR